MRCAAETHTVSDWPPRHCPVPTERSALCVTQVRGWEAAEGVIFSMHVDNYGIRPTLVLQSNAVQPNVTFQLHVLINERGAAELSGVADEEGGMGAYICCHADFHSKLLLHQTGVNGIELGSEPPNFHVPCSQGAWQFNNALTRSMCQWHSLAANGTFNCSPGSGQYFCQGHSTLAIVVCADLTRGMVVEAPPSVRDGEEWCRPIAPNGARRSPLRIEWEGTRDSVRWRLQMPPVGNVYDETNGNGDLERLMSRLFPNGLRSASLRVHERFGLGAGESSSSQVS